MEAESRESLDIIRQRELLEAIHESHFEQLKTAGTIGRLLRTNLGSSLADTLSYVRPYRNFRPDSNDQPADITALEVGVPRQRLQLHCIIDLGYLTTTNEPMSFGDFLPEDVQLVEGMLDGLYQDYNLALLPNLSPNCNTIWSSPTA